LLFLTNSLSFQRTRKKKITLPLSESSGSDDEFEKPQSIFQCNNSNDLKHWGREESKYIAWKSPVENWKENIEGISKWNEDFYA